MIIPIRTCIVSKKRETRRETSTNKTSFFLSFNSVTLITPNRYQFKKLREAQSPINQVITQCKEALARTRAAFVNTRRCARAPGEMRESRLRVYARNGINLNSNIWVFNRRVQMLQRAKISKSKILSLEENFEEQEG